MMKIIRVWYGESLQLAMVCTISLHHDADQNFCCAIATPKILVCVSVMHSY